MSSAQALPGTALTEAPRPGARPARAVPAAPAAPARPEIVRATGHARGATVVEKTLSVPERLYNQAWLRKVVILLVLAGIEGAAAAWALRAAVDCAAKLALAARLYPPAAEAARRLAAPLAGAGAGLLGGA